ncbi:MAG: tetratricopeptide repeat protein [Proteobacteria bacterium]|nr:tetratricopeptide repeat protein [Pseudomonadota bacterium]
MFPHQKLDWHIKRLEDRLEKAPDDGSLRLELALSALSKAWFHNGGEVWMNHALTAARRVLQHDPTSPGAQVVAGFALVGLHRLEPAARYLDEALRTDAERSDLHLALGALAHAKSDRHLAVREFELACRLAPNEWEPHYMLGQLLGEHADSLGGPRRLIERSQFHLVRALSIGTSPQLQARLVKELGVATMKLGRHNEAQKLFSRLLEHDEHRVNAHYHLGLVDYHLGKYKNAVLHLRQYHRARPDNPHVHARIGMAYMQLGEVAKAREACNRALAIDPTSLQARWTLGCALLEEGHTDEAVRLFRDILTDAPEHTPAFAELVRVRREARDGRWLRTALRTEVTHYERLPASARREAMGGRVDPRAATRDRIRRVARAIVTIDPDAVTALLEAMDLTADEGMRFLLWEEALSAMAERRARSAMARLEEPGHGYGAAAGREILALAEALDPVALTHGLQLNEEDLKRAAVDRHGPALDVSKHRDNVERERQEARAWQALLLVAIGARSAEGSRNLLVRWSNDADPELQLAASSALALLGDEGAVDRLRGAARPKGAERHLDQLVTRLAPPPTRYTPTPVSGESQLLCDTCGKRGTDTEHILVGSGAKVCDACITKIARDRRNTRVSDPTAACALCHATHLEGREVYLHQGVKVCAGCIDQSLGLLEREEIDRYLAAQ